MVVFSFSNIRNKFKLAPVGVYQIKKKYKHSNEKQKMDIAVCHLSFKLARKKAFANME